MQPYKIEMYVYADSQQEADRLQATLRAFVESKRNQGVAVTASSLTNAVERFGTHPLINNFLRYGYACTKTQPISQEFSVPIQSATAPTSVTVTAGATINSIEANGCDKCSRTFVSETPISIAVA